MNIILVGGSNTGISYGWARQFQAAAKRHVVANRFLGAVGSLFGLLRLMEAEREGAPLPDLVIFEYSLNDMMLLDSGCVTPAQLRDTLLDVIGFCASRGLALLFLCLEVQPIGRQRVHACVAVVKDLYVEVAREHGVRCLTLDEILGPPRPEDFADEHHLSEDVSKRVVDRLLLEIALGRVTIPEAPPARPPAFFYHRTVAALPLGPCRRVDIASTVFSGKFLEIARGGASLWPGRGDLVGLMLRSTQTAGEFAISAGRRRLRKNAQSGMRAAAPRLMLLHYLTKPLACADDLEISMPESEAELIRLREDRTPLAAAPETPFDAQLLEIHGVMMWRRAAIR
ncbi:SGNH/GDSL hydrolase family protein [Methylosinus sp. Sm6]|uniref:SGNH/GDSL hydrolase family protein n=1 Tax=Methylosinus sp. Sm6 TaxID=2866948 RepID=UPI001C998C9B|nr:SGNH/GDSL hydrolase family protein [Methylosinus sp. Sm6]MBY6242375.1 SGNH/GDSL hydrolase family protein [Methylosinus sp. Sm6]